MGESWGAGGVGQRQPLLGDNQDSWGRLGQKPCLSPERLLASLVLFWVLYFGDPLKVSKLLESLSEALEGLSPQASHLENGYPTTARVNVEKTGTGVGVSQRWVGVGTHHRPEPDLCGPTHSPHQQMQPHEEDSDSGVLFHLQCKEMLQHVLATLSSAAVLSPQPAAHLHQDGRPHSPRKDRWVSDPARQAAVNLSKGCSQPTRASQGLSKPQPPLL